MNNKYKIYLLAFVGFLVSTSQFMIAGILDKISHAFSVSISDAGQLITIFAVASGLGTPFVIMYLSKFKLKTQLIITLVIFLISTILTPLSPNYEYLMFSRAITGLFTSTFIVIAYTLASKLAKEGKQGSAMADIALGMSLALVVGVPFGRIITLQYDWQAVFWILASLVFLGTLAILKLIPNLENDKPIPLKEQLLFLKKPQTMLPLGITFLIFSSYSVINTYITPLLQSINGVTEHQIGVAFFAIGIASLLGSKMGASLADKVGVTPILFATMFVFVVSLSGIPVFSQSIITVITMLVLLTGAIWMFGPTQSFNLSTLAPNSTGIIIGLNSSFVQLGFAVGAGVGGVAIHSYPTSMLGWVAALIGVCAIFVAVFHKWLMKVKNRILD